MGIEALILGLDGVILDTEAAHLEACNAAFAACGLGLQWSLPQLRQAARIWGATHAVSAVVEKLSLPRAGKEAIRLMQEKNRLFHDAASARQPQLIPACMSLMEEAMERGCKLAVVTDSPAQTATALLDQAFGGAVTNLFATVVSGADFAGSSGNGPYQLAVRTIGVEAAACVGIDTAAPALRAAQEADIWAMAVGPYEKDIARISGAQVWCPQWRELRYWTEPKSRAREDAEPLIDFDALDALRMERRADTAFNKPAPVQLAA